MKKINLLLLILTVGIFTSAKSQTKPKEEKLITVQLPVADVEILLLLLEKSKNAEVEFGKQLNLYNSIYYQAMQQLQPPKTDSKPDTTSTKKAPPVKKP